MPGARYMVTALPLISLLVGLGATRLLHLAPSGRVRWSVATLLVATLLLPTLTHRSVYSDTLRNPQHEFLFAMDVQRFMDPQTLVIVPDHGPSGEVHDPEGAVGISWFRTWALYRTLSHLKGLGEWGVSTLGDLPKRQESGQRRLLFVMTTDCYRHRLAQTLAPLCQRVAALPGTRTLLQTTFPNRIMTQASFTYDLGPRVPEIELRLLELPPMDGPTLSLLLAPKNP